MTFELTCKYCASAIVLERFATSCPICSEVLFPDGLGERRSLRGVPVVRDWITRLRLSGADFDKDAARTTLEFADSCAARGMRPTDLFDLSRTFYYQALGSSGGRGRQNRVDRCGSSREGFLDEGLRSHAVSRRSHHREGFAEVGGPRRDADRNASENHRALSVRGLIDPPFVRWDSQEERIHRSRS
jgi:hypothetical protein